MIEWNIQPRAHACQACRKSFVDKQPYHTLLFDHKRDYERLDICERCWESQYSQGATDRKGYVSFWQGTYTVPPAAAPDPIRKETAETLLRKLIEQNEPNHAAARYILAVMLERKRLFKVKAQLAQEDQRVFVYEHAKTGELFQVPDPKLQLDQLEDVQRDVARLLEHGPNPPAHAQPAVAPEAGMDSAAPPEAASAEPAAPAGAGPALEPNEAR